MKIEIQEGFPDVEIVIRCPAASQEIDRLASLLQHSGKKLLCKKNGVTHLIDNQDVLYVESVDKRSFIYTAKDFYETDLKLYEIEERLTDVFFFRSSKSQILNISKIASLCPEFGGRMEVVMENGERLLVSRQYSKLLKERLRLQ